MTAVVGVDLGGTKVAAAPLTGDALGQSILQPTNVTSRDALLDQLVEVVTEVRSPDLVGVGIGVPSVVEFETGRVISSTNVPLDDVPLRHVLSNKLGLPVFVDNDATVAALAETYDEQLRPAARNLVMLTFGTGVGGGIVLGGRIYRGSTGGAGELGHTIIGLAGDVDVAPGGTFPRAGSLESLASGHALDRLAEQAAEDHPESALGQLRLNGQVVTGRDNVKAAHTGDLTAVAAIETWGKRVGIGVANAINTFDPDEVVIGGGAAQAGKPLLAMATRVARAYVAPGLGTRTNIRLARHGPRAGVLGAALLAVHELEQEADYSHHPPDGARSVSLEMSQPRGAR